MGPKLVDYLVEHQIPLEVCPSSNVCTRVFDSMADPSIGRLLEAGARGPLLRVGLEEQRGDDIGVRPRRP